MGALVEAVELQVDIDRLAPRPLRSPSAATNRLSVASRMPLVLRLTLRIGLACAKSMKSRMCLWMVGSPPENITTSASPSDSTNTSSMRSHCPSVIE
jgi:hypothetical protein